MQLDCYAVVGNPIAHSKSPFIHHFFATQCGQQLQYDTCLAPLGSFKNTVDHLRQNPAVKGINITTPFKQDAFAYAQQHSAIAQFAGAANALHFTADGVFAENFDGVGLIRDIVDNLQQPLRAQTVLLLGSGGAARGILLPLLQQAPAHIIIANRSINSAHTLADVAQNYLKQQAPNLATKIVAVTLDALSDTEHHHARYIINATSSGLQNTPLVLPNTTFSACQLAYDLSYGKGLTDFLQQAKTNGVPILADGIGMLVEQAAEAFWWWRGVRPHTQAVLEILKTPPK